MLNAKAFANASTIVFLAVYIICRVISLIAPDLLFSVAKSWFHTFSVDSLKVTVSMDIGTFIFGAVTLSILVWTTTYAIIVLYNSWEK